MGLQHQAGGNLAAANGGHELLQIWNLADIRTFVDQAAHMDRQAASVLIICPFAEQIEKLGVAQGNQEIEGAVGVGHDEEQGGFLIAQGVQLQFVIGGDLTEFRNIEGSESCAAGNEDGFRRLA